MFVLKSVILLLVVNTVHCLPMLGNLGMLGSHRHQREPKPSEEPWTGSKPRES